MPGSSKQMTLVSEWTVDTLKVLMDERDERYKLMATNARDAMELYRADSVKWRESQNEWRAAMSDKDRNFVTKNALWGYAVGIVGLILSLILILEKVRGGS